MTRTAPRWALATMLLALVASGLALSVDATPATAQTAPTVTVTPSTDLVDGQQVTVTTTGFPVREPGGLVYAGLCRADGVRLDDCDDQGADNAQSFPMIAFENVQTILNQSFSCFEVDCVIWVAELDAVGNTVATAESAPLRFAPKVTVSPSSGLVNGQSVSVNAKGFTDIPGGFYFTAQCMRDYAAFDNCSGNTTQTAEAPTSLELTVYQEPLSWLERTFSCIENDCVVMVIQYDANGDPVNIVPSNSLHFGAPTASVDPAADLIDGQTVTLHASGLESSTRYKVVHCPAAERSFALYSCEPLDGAPGVTADSAGAVTTDVTAVQRFKSAGGRYLHCTDNCTIALVGDAPSGPIAASAPYTMATGSITVTPNTGLSSGQVVQVDASGIQPTYAGPNLLLPTGGWGLAQCDASIGDHPPLWVVFQKCGAPPEGGGVTIDASGTLSVARTVRSSFTAYLGDQISCATAGGCVVALTRWEQDGTVTTHLAPITFG